MAKNRKPRYKWVVMIYACANDKDSEVGMTNFFKELNKVGKGIDKKGSKTELKILLQAYRNWGTPQRHSYYSKRFEIKGNFLKKGRMPPDVVYTHLYTNMGDPNALSDFIICCKDNYPADHYLLLLWGHGAQYGMFTGTINRKKQGLMKLISPKNFSMTLKGDNKKLFVNQIKPVGKTIAGQFSDIQDVMVTYKTRGKNGLAETDNIKRKIINSWPPDGNREEIIPPTVIYYFDADENNRSHRLTELIPRRPIDDSLTIEEICKSLWDTGQYVKGFGNIEILMILGCAMQTFELAYELSKCRSLNCKYLIASEELIYWEGYAYKESFLRLLENPGMSARKLSKHIVKDTEYKLPGEKNRNDGHRDKDAWAISSVDIKKCGKAARLINNISGKLLDFPSFAPFDRSKGNRAANSINPYIKWIYGYSEALLQARISCHHFGENAFRASYIDITWFYKKFKCFLEQNDFLNRTMRKSDPSLYKKYRRLIGELKSAIVFLQKEFIVNPWIGKKRGEKAQWKKILLGKNKPRKEFDSSTGAHGLAIYFPFSGSSQRSDKKRELFFECDSDYNLEFSKNKSLEKKFVKSRDSWNEMIKRYQSWNRKTDYRFFKKNKISSNEKNIEPAIIR